MSMTAGLPSWLRKVECTRGRSGFRWELLINGIWRSLRESEKLLGINSNPLLKRITILAKNPRECTLDDLINASPSQLNPPNIQPTVHPWLRAVGKDMAKYGFHWEFFYLNEWVTTATLAEICGESMRNITRRVKLCLEYPGLSLQDFILVLPRNWDQIHGSEKQIYPTSFIDLPKPLTSGMCPPAAMVEQQMRLLARGGMI